LDERLADEEKTEGESDALKARANYLTKIGDKVGSILFSVKPVFIVGLQDRALEAQKLVLLVLTLVRIGLLFGDTC
jgi:hypothetical protein